MSWSRVVEGFDPKVLNECRAGILVGLRLPDGLDSDEALSAQHWARDHGVELWIVDDLLGLAPKQPIFLGIAIHQAFGIDDDHRRGLAPAEYAERVAAATRRMEELKPGAAIAPHFVWSGPLCGGFLVKGVFRDEYDDDDLWFETDAPCAVTEACRGARQDTAPGGVLGVQLFRATYDGENDPPPLTAKLLASGDEPLAAAGLLRESRIFALPHYD